MNGTVLRGMLSALALLLIAILWVGPQGPPRVVALTVIPGTETRVSESGIPATLPAETVSEVPAEATESPQEAAQAIPVVAVVADTSPTPTAPVEAPPSMRSDIPNSAWSPPLVGPQAAKPLTMNGVVIPGAWQCYDQWGYTTNWTEPICWPGTAGRPPENPVPTALTPHLP